MTDRRSTIATRIRVLEDELAELSKFGDDVYSNGTVIKFKYRYSMQHILNRRPMIRNDRGDLVVYHNLPRQEFTFYACKVKGGWYLSGRSSNRMTWDDLVAMWTDGEVRKMRIATGWAKFFSDEEDES